MQCGTSLEKAKGFGEKYGIPHAFNSYQEMSESQLIYLSSARHKKVCHKVRSNYTKFHAKSSFLFQSIITR
jgi:predicted dehydrogenase